jgi:ApbE superfamily uncharacterized protein (UPF0280 family)
MHQDGPDYTDRTYRRSMRADDLVRFTVKVRETDLCILAQTALRDEAREAVKAARADVEAQIRACPEFAAAVSPLPYPPDAPELIRDMCAAGEAAGVGPMAAVAGAIAERVARALEPLSPNVIVENGGDTYIMGKRRRLAGVFAGESPLSNRFGLHIPPNRQPIAVCTSSGTVGPSLSLGQADAAVIAAESGALADAAATTIANRIRTRDDLSSAIEFAASLDGVLHVVAIVGDQMATWGHLALRRLT